MTRVIFNRLFFRLSVAGLAVAAAIATPTAASAGNNNGVLGALIGAGAGAAIGHQVNRRGGAGQGAIIGALGGYLLGNKMNGAQAAPAPAQASPRTFDDCASAARYYEQSKSVLDREKKVYLLQNSVRQCTGSALYHNDLGVAYYQRNHAYDRERARAEINQALRIDPNYQSARQNLNNM